jgi:hypothetical protein
MSTVSFQKLPGFPRVQKLPDLPKDLVDEIWKNISQLYFQDVLYQLEWFWIKRRLDKRLIGPRVILNSVRGLRCTACVSQHCLCQLRVQSRRYRRWVPCLPRIQCNCDSPIPDPLISPPTNCVRCKKLRWAPAFTVDRIPA